MIETVDLIPENIDADEFLERMPARLLADLKRGYGDVRAALAASMEYPSPDKKAVMLDGKPVVLFGAAKPEADEPAEMWKVESGGFERIKTSYMRILLRYSEMWGKKYGAFRVFINAEFPEMLRFVEWLGWSVRPLGPEFQNYCEVYKSWDSQ